jgi:PAS domain S-box-containing protein
MASRICFISPSQECTILYKKTLSSLPDPPPVFEGAIKAAETAARAALKQGYEILITAEQNARHLWGKIDTPIVAIPLTALDIARAINRAKKEYGEPVAFFKSHQPYVLLSALREILDCKFKEFVFDGKKDCLSKLNEAIKEGFHAVVGGAIITPMARERGIPCVPLLPLPEDILKTFHQAQHIASVRQIEEREAMKFKHVVKYAFSGIIVTDEKNKIVVFNPAAELIFGIPANQVLDHDLEEVIPQSQLTRGDHKEHPRLEELRTIRRKQLMVNRIPITEEEKTLGMILTFQEVSNIQSLEEKIRRAGHTKGLSAKLTFQDIIGESKIIGETILRAQHFAQTDETILITGESGTGKEVFAQSIHNASPRRSHPFLAVNCSAISPSLLESELFGYAEGAFTGARRGGKQGMFELAHWGTIFLDEVSELSREAQGHLLRVLQEKEVMRVGDAKVTPVNVRVIAATNRPLEEVVQQGLFRWDLYHRLNVLRLRLPPLREHPEDVLPLADGFIAKWCPNPVHANQMKEILSKYESLLTAYAWPGNVRELQNLLRRMVSLIGRMTGESIEQEIRELLSETVGNSLALAFPMRWNGQGNLKLNLKGVASELIRRQHAELQGNKKELTRRLGISRTTLWRRLKEAEPR